MCMHHRHRIAKFHPKTIRISARRSQCVKCAPLSSMSRAPSKTLLIRHTHTPLQVDLRRPKCRAMYAITPPDVPPPSPPPTLAPFAPAAPAVNTTTPRPRRDDPPTAANVPPTAASPSSLLPPPPLLVLPLLVLLHPQPVGDVGVMGGDVVTDDSKTIGAAGRCFGTLPVLIVAVAAAAFGRRFDRNRAPQTLLDLLIVATSDVIGSGGGGAGARTGCVCCVLPTTMAGGPFAADRSKTSSSSSSSDDDEPLPSYMLLSRSTALSATEGRCSGTGNGCD